MSITHNDEAFATMLLMSQITPSREELVRPLTNGEWHALKKKVREAGLGGLGALIDMDMSGFMISLDMTEQEAYRMSVLLSRVLPLTVSMEQFAMRGIDVLTYDERPYPARLRERLALRAPAMVYLSGRSELFLQDAVAILGSMPAREGVEAEVRALTAMAVEAGYIIVTDGTVGLGRIAEDEALRQGGRVLEVLGGGQVTRVEEPDMAGMLSSRRGAALSLVHPFAPYTASHATSRNKCIYALCQAAFIFAAEEKKGATWDGACEAIARRWCDAVYAYDTGAYAGNRPLIARGASPFSAVTPGLFAQMTRTWRSQAARQMSLFDTDEPIG